MPRSFDPNAIPDRDRGGRMGELDPGAPEERESSALSTSEGAEAGAHGDARGDRFQPEPPPLEDRRTIDTAIDGTADRRHPPATERRRR